MRYTSVISSLALVSSSLAVTGFAPLEGYTLVDLEWSGMFNNELINTTGTIQVT